MGRTIPPAWLDVWLSATFFIFAGLSSPHLLHRFITLHWCTGDMHAAAYSLEVCFAFLGVFGVLRRRPISAAFAKAFPTTKSLGLTVASLVCSLPGAWESPS
jgi:hypothetical protein